MKKEFLLQKADNEVWYGFFPALRDAGIRHGISTRLGGISEQPFATLNLGLHTGDQQDRVVENRKRFAAAVGVNFDKVVTAEQVHGDRIAVVTDLHAGSGAVIYEQALSGVDALVTNCKGLPLMLFFADCVPVLIADPMHQAIGISHAGWKGTVSQIAARTVAQMTASFQTVPADCLAAIGPSIGPCCYEIDEHVISRLKTMGDYWPQLVKESLEDNRWMLNLWEANRRQLLMAGLKSANIYSSEVCTVCNVHSFFSYRAEQGHTGRIGAVIEL